MRKDISELTNKLSNHLDKIRNIKRNEQYSEEYKQEKINEVKQELTEYENKKFESIEQKFDKLKQKNKDKLNKLFDGSYDQKSYEYLKASKEVENYDDPSDYYNAKKDKFDNDIQALEVRKVVSSKLEATNKGKYENFKDQLVENMKPEEKELRKDIKAAEIRKQNLNDIKNHYDFVKEQALIDRDYLDKGKKDLISITDNNETIEQKATKKISETL